MKNTGNAGGKMKETGTAHWNTQYGILAVVLQVSAGGYRVGNMGHSLATSLVEFYGEQY
jgi:hypothetical protein